MEKKKKKKKAPLPLPQYDNPPDERIKEILTAHKYVAVVGLVPDQTASSNRVARFLKRHSFTLYPINPRYPSVLGEDCKPYVRYIEGPVDILQVFRRPEHLAGLIEDAVTKGAKVIWLQLGIVNLEFGEQAKAAGLEVIMNRCMKKEYERLVLKRTTGPKYAK